MTRSRLTLVSLGLVAAAVAAGACGPPEPMLVDGLFTQAEWEKVNTLSPLPAAPEVPSNKYADDPRAAALGQKLFFDKTYSGPVLSANNPHGATGATDRLSCTACHKPDHGFADDQKLSTGASALNGRQTLGLLNTHYYEWSGWTGFIDVMWGHAIIAGPECASCLNTSRLAVARHMYEKYRAEYDAVFPTPLDPDLDPAAPGYADGGRRFPLLTAAERPLGKPVRADGGTPQWASMSPADQAHVTGVVVNYGKAIDAYVRKLVSTNSPFDQYVAGDKAAISTSAKRGLKLFVGKAACVECHSKPHFSDDKFHNDGVEQPKLADGGYRVDDGRFNGVTSVIGNNKVWSSDGPYTDAPRGLVNGLADAGPVPMEEKGRFRTKGLRSVALTAPYMHTGELATLGEVVQFYNQGGAPQGFSGTKDEVLKPLNLTDQEVDDLVAFLESLTGEPLPAALMAAP